MKITEILINQMKHSFGFDLSNLQITFKVNGKWEKNTTKSIEIIDANRNKVIFTSIDERYENNVFEINTKLKPRTRYLVKVSVNSGINRTSATTYFETGKMNEPLQGKWIGNSNKNLQNTIFKKEFILKKKKIEGGRLYLTGLGVYEAYLNNKKIGKEFLAPGFTDYKKWIQLQTYDISDQLVEGKNTLLVSVGNGWYKGRIGFGGGQENTFGDQQMIIGELHLKYEDGEEQIVSTDKNWVTSEGKIKKSAIYYGEDYDDTISIKHWVPVEVLPNAIEPIYDRLSLPIMKKEVLKVKKVIKVSNDEYILDFGQNHAGWPVFLNNLPQGKKIILQMGEVLQNGKFYNKNLRKARATFTYISNGEKKWVRPHFTYFGYRYVKVSGINKIDKAKFESWVLYSDLEQTGKILTNNSKVNRLFKNVLWGEKSNFFDIPTDCPQRDERLGWTGDAEIFSKTASFNMNTFAFFKKYSKDMKIEQTKHNGMLTMVVPDLNYNNGGIAIWGDAATIIPWQTYMFYGDKNVLKQNYAQMKLWVKWVTEHTSKKYMWTGTMQLGDWLSLDNGKNPKGKTDENYIASIYYALSVGIVARTARILGNEIDAKIYTKLLANIKAKIREEYVSSSGRIAIDTQTAYALALNNNIVLYKQRNQVIKDLVKSIEKNNKHLNTGFVGTPSLLPALSENNKHSLAVDIFLQEDYPSWLYEINQGATTIWERWNSVLPNGKMNSEGMNSLNHYSLGAVIEWLYQSVVGIRHFNPGFKEIVFSPQFDYRLRDIDCTYETTYGKLKINYHIETNRDHKIEINIKVPFGSKVLLDLPRSKGMKINVNNTIKHNKFELTGGSYSISYIPSKSYLNYYNLNSRVKDILNDAKLVKRIDKIGTNILDKVKRPGNTQSMFINSKISDLLEFENISTGVKEEVRQLLQATLR